ncbi:alpha-L-fucosidase [Flammeovirgaceae bacterium SG7u.111]|nr:alpha-L-fucosidase [Flammeovirgaceae bacterium SG7u.132]WPO36433.1 alpha-L-fucosidase [Flammeovirgaceae bacterium SG7u.111]
MKNTRISHSIIGLVCILGFLSLTQCSNPKETIEHEAISSTKSLYQLKSEFIDQRFGMFICYNVMSYGAKWGEANYPIDSFNPQKLDCAQWADAAVSAGMKYGLLTTKHHEGFCLWDSKFTEYDVASTPYQKDIVRQYVDAFRVKGLGIGLYYSIWDSTHGVEKDSIDGNKLDFVKGQITELLTNYGKIDYFVMDGWYWKIGHKVIPYHEIRKLIRQLQPECLITDHTHLQAPYHMEIPYFEGPFGAFPPEGNTMASALGHCSVKGNGWFWSEDTPNGMKQDDGIDTVLHKLVDCEARYCNFMLNCMPNREGLLDDIYIGMLTEIGQKWKPDTSRPALPPQGRQIVESIPFASVVASSGNATYLHDARQIQTNHFHWESSAEFPQTITMDLGKIEEGVDALMIVPNHRCKPYPEMALAEGNIMNIKLFSSTDGLNFEEVSSQRWGADATYKSLNFEKTKARYFRLDILEANGEKAIIAELEIGRSSL